MRAHWTAKAPAGFVPTLSCEKHNFWNPAISKAAVMPATARRRLARMTSMSQFIDLAQFHANFQMTGLRRIDSAAYLLGQVSE